MIEIRLLQASDINQIVSAFEDIGWHKPASLFHDYLKEQSHNERFVWVAFKQKHFVGYVTLKVHSAYVPFANQNIPEIKDLNVLPTYQHQGIGTKLMDEAEAKAYQLNAIVGIGVGLSADYGNAQKLYVKRGYIPDGKGITYLHESVKWGVTYKVDDDLLLWFTKERT